MTWFLFRTSFNIKHFGYYFNFCKFMVNSTRTHFNLFNQFILLLSFSLIFHNDGMAQNTSSRSLNSLNNWTEHAHRSEPTSDGGVIISGITQDSTGSSSKGFLIKLDSLFQLKWSKLYDTGVSCSFSAALETDDKGFIAAGRQTTSLMNPFGTTVIKTDSIGVVQWSKVYAGSNANSISKTNDGGYILSGSTMRSFPGGGNSVICVTKIDSMGNLEWINSYGGVPGYVETAFCSKPTMDNGFIITGFTTGFNSNIPTAYLLKVNNTGSVVWSKTYDGIYSTSGFDIVELPDSSFIVTGKGQFSWLICVSIMKTDKNGNVQWSNIFTNPSGGGAGNGFRIIATHDDGFIVSALVYPGPTITLFKTDSVGNLDWMKEFGSYPSNTGLISSGGLWESNPNEFIFSATVNTNSGDVYIAKTTSSPDSCSIMPNNYYSIPYFPIESNIFFLEVPLFNEQVIILNTIDSVFKDSTICPMDVSTLIHTNDTKYIKVYPNPTRRYINIEFSNIEPPINLIEIFTIHGVRLNNLNISYGANEAKIDLQDYPDGLYFVRVGKEFEKIIKL